MGLVMAFGSEFLGFSFNLIKFSHGLFVFVLMELDLGLSSFFYLFFCWAGIISYYFMVWWLSWDVTLYHSSQIFLFGIGKGVSMHWFSTWEFQSLCITGCTRGCTLAIFSPIIILCTMLLLWHTPLQVQTTKYQRQLFLTCLCLCATVLRSFFCFLPILHLLLRKPGEKLKLKNSF